MKYGLVNTEKLYFSSKETAETLGISVKDLHKLESKSPELNPKINANGKRIYKQSDIEIAKKIVNSGTNLVGANPCVCHPVKVKNVCPIAKNKPKKSNPAATAPTNPDVLLQVRNKLQNTLERLRNK